MECAVCRNELSDKNYITFVWDKGQVIICKSCTMRGMRNVSGSIICRDTVIAPPRLVLGLTIDTLPSEFVQAAADEGWIVQSVLGWEPTDEDVIVSEHIGKAMVNRWFAPTGKWAKDVSLSQVECFRRSCVNIRDYYAVFLNGAEG